MSKPDRAPPGPAATSLFIRSAIPVPDTNAIVESRLFAAQAAGDPLPRPIDP
jgi:hypothetical protein